MRWGTNIKKINVEKDSKQININIENIENNEGY